MGMAVTSAVSCSPDTVVDGPYGVSKAGVVKGAGKLTAFDRTGNAYGMEAWVYVSTGNNASEGFAWTVVAPYQTKTITSPPPPWEAGFKQNNGRRFFNQKTVLLI